MDFHSFLMILSFRVCLETLANFAWKVLHHTFRLLFSGGLLTGYIGGIVYGNNIRAAYNNSMNYIDLHFIELT